VAPGKPPVIVEVAPDQPAKIRPEVHPEIAPKPDK
jgi:hypothetical protein